MPPTSAGTKNIYEAPKKPSSMKSVACNNNPQMSEMEQSELLVPILDENQNAQCLVYRPVAFVEKRARSDDTNKNSTIDEQTKKKVCRRKCAKKAAVEEKPSFTLIAEHDIVLGDTSSRETRTTLATDELRNLKSEFKDRFKGAKRSLWIDKAIGTLHDRLAACFPGVANVGRVLIKCTDKNKDRIANSKRYGYDGDKKADFAEPKDEYEALVKFFNSRDSPVLSKEIARYQRELTLLKTADFRPPKLMTKRFEERLFFFVRQVELSEQGNDVSAQMFLKDLSPINTLKNQWKHLMKSRQLQPLHVEKTDIDKPTSPHAHPVYSSNDQPLATLRNLTLELDQLSMNLKEMYDEVGLNHSMMQNFDNRLSIIKKQLEVSDCDEFLRRMLAHLGPIPLVQSDLERQEKAIEPLVAKTSVFEHRHNLSYTADKEQSNEIPEYIDIHESRSPRAVPSVDKDGFPEEANVSLCSNSLFGGKTNSSLEELLLTSSNFHLDFGEDTSWLTFLNSFPQDSDPEATGSPHEKRRRRSASASKAFARQVATTDLRSKMSIRGRYFGDQPILSSNRKVLTKTAKKLANSSDFDGPSNDREEQSISSRIDPPGHFQDSEIEYSRDSFQSPQTTVVYDPLQNRELTDNVSVDATPFVSYDAPAAPSVTEYPVNIQHQAPYFSYYCNEPRVPVLSIEQSKDLGQAKYQEEPEKNIEAASPVQAEDTQTPVLVVSNPVNGINDTWQLILKILAATNPMPSEGIVQIVPEIGTLETSPHVEHKKETLILDDQKTSKLPEDCSTTKNIDARTCEKRVRFDNEPDLQRHGQSTTSVLLRPPSRDCAGEKAQLRRPKQHQDRECTASDDSNQDLRGSKQCVLLPGAVAISGPQFSDSEPFEDLPFRNEEEGGRVSISCFYSNDRGDSRKHLSTRLTNPDVPVASPVVEPTEMVYAVLMEDENDDTKRQRQKLRIKLFRPWRVFHALVQATSRRRRRRGKRSKAQLGDDQSCATARTCSSNRSCTSRVRRGYPRIGLWQDESRTSRGGGSLMEEFARDFPTTSYEVS